MSWQTALELYCLVLALIALPFVVPWRALFRRRRNRRTGLKAPEPKTIARNWPN